MTTDARALAAAIGDLDAPALAALLRGRAVHPSAPWHDLFDAAEALLAPASVELALGALPRDELTALADAVAGGHPVDSAVHDALVARALVRPDGAPYAVVAGLVPTLLAAHPGATDGPAAGPSAPASAAQSARAAERAWESAGILADVAMACLAAPLARTGAGAVTAADRRRITDAGIVATGDDLEALLDAGRRAGLLVPLEREWAVSESGEAWLGESSAERWRIVADGIVATLPAALRSSDGCWIAIDGWSGALPLDDAWPAHAARLRAGLVQWGLVAEDGAEPPWTAARRRTGAFDVAALAGLLPPEIDRIYLQADLTAIAPGALQPEIDLRLRGMARQESRAQACTYRFTDESLAAAVADGETADGIRSFLSAVSLTGIPQPLDYLIERAAARHGRITVQTDAATERTRVGSDDARLLQTIEIDQSLRALGLVAEGRALETRVSRDAVYWALHDAHYPVSAVDPAGRPEPLRRRRVIAPPADSPADRYARLIEVLQRSRHGDTDAAWLERELEAAVRTRATIVLSVALPGGETREFTVEATGLGGGRLRGRDRGADIERTLPLSSIRSVRAAG